MPHPIPERTAQGGTHLPGSPRALRTPWFFLGLLSFLLPQCIFDDRQAGTSTSVTNPAAVVTGFAILEDGSPAAGAEISLRKPIIQVSHEGVPASRQVGYAIADSAGRFSVPLVFMEDVYMEIRESRTSPRGVPRDSLQAHLRRWPNGLPHDGKMGTFRLNPPGTLTGRLETPHGDSLALRWVGVRGTDNFTKAPDRNPFRLSGVSSGQRELVVVSVPDTGVWAGDPARKPVVHDFAAQDTVKSGGVTDLGGVFYYIE
jgi:hypothetical protein